MITNACCWTDHYLVKGKLVLDFSRMHWNHVTRVSLAVYHLKSQEVKDKY